MTNVNTRNENRVWLLSTHWYLLLFKSKATEWSKTHAAWYVYSYDLPLGEVTSLYLSKSLRLKIFAEQKDNLPACIQDGPSSLVDFLAGSSIQVSLFKLRKFSGIKKGRQVTEYLLLTNKALSSKGLQRFAVAYGLRSIHLMILNSYWLPTTISFIHMTFTEFYDSLVF